MTTRPALLPPRPTHPFERIVKACLWIVTGLAWLLLYLIVTAVTHSA
jgi:hypothetical protein